MFHLERAKVIINAGRDGECGSERDEEPIQARVKFLINKIEMHVERKKEKKMKEKEITEEIANIQLYA